MKHLYLYIILIFSICSCNIENKTNKSILPKLIGKNIIFPSNIQFINHKSQKKETLNLKKKLNF